MVMKIISLYIHNYKWIKIMNDKNSFKMAIKNLVEKNLIPEILKQEGE